MHTLPHENIVSRVAQKLVMKEFVGMLTLGNPSPTPEDQTARIAAFASARNGAGFRQYPDERRKTKNGMTRAQRTENRRVVLDAVTTAYHANLVRARELGLIGMSYIEPTKVAKLLSDHDGITKTKKSRTKKTA